MQRLRRPSAALLLLSLSSCLAAPPSVSFETLSGTVRADSQLEARTIADKVRELSPRLLATLPGSELSADLEVWMQDEPHLYTGLLDSASGAEGLYSPGHHRIMLGRYIEDKERVLAHELVHAAIDASWSPLRGTLEEGLCDVVAAEVVPEQAARLRAGRLASAALACGGLRIGLDVHDSRPRGSAKIGWSAAIQLTTQGETPESPLSMFRVQAGLTSTPLKASVKRGYYGLAFLVVDRIGVDSLYHLCRRAEFEGFDRLPLSWLLEAANLDEETSTWRRAAAEGMGDAELIELIRMYPSSTAGALAHFAAKMPGTFEERWQALEGEVRLDEGTASVTIEQLDFLKEDVRAQL